VLKSVAVQRILVERGQEVIIGVSAKHAGFLEAPGIPHEILADIQENDDASLPTVESFRHPQKETFLWDIPEFLSITKASDTTHVGPVFWNEPPKTCPICPRF